MAVVTKIPATKNKFTSAPMSQTSKRRVAAYARVSTDKDEQITSYNAQVDYYKKYIQNNPDWEYVDVYADEGITGTSTKSRKRFNEMIDDAVAGRIDLIITKSVSRFARNTVDTLVNIRKLKDAGVECFFEEQGIWTFDSTGELMITMLSSIQVQIAKVDADFEVTAALVAAAVKENATLPQSQEEYQKKYAALEEQFTAQKKKRTALEEKIEERKARAHELDLFIDALTENDLILSEWDEQLWLTLVEKGAVLPDGSINFLFKDGTEILAAE